MKLPSLAGWVLTLSLVAAPFSSPQAALIVSPGANAAVEGNANNIFPFSSFDPMRYQQVFSAADFLSGGGPLRISEIRFRADTSQGAASDSIPDLRVDLNTSSSAPDGLSSTTADNVGADNVTVYSGAWAFSTAAGGPPGGPNPFDIVLTLQTPFIYNPAAGNLLMDVRTDAHTSIPSFIFDSSDSPLDTVSRLYWSGDRNSPFGTTDTFGLIAQFNAAAIPEPSTYALMLAGLGFVGFVASRKRKSQWRAVA